MNISHFTLLHAYYFSMVAYIIFYNHQKNT